ncbi:MAG: lysylphosphatidylglycerol synthase transmembrane domain-containing protein [Caldilineales bacterium]
MNEQRPYRLKRHLMRAMPWLIALSVAVFLFRKGGDWRQTPAVLAQVNGVWFVAALASQAASYGTMTELNLVMLRQYGVPVPWIRIYSTQLARVFVDTAIPSGTVGGLVVRARLLDPYGASADVTTVTGLAEVVMVYAAILVFALFVGGAALMSGVPVLAGGQWQLWLAGAAGLVLAALLIWRRQRQIAHGLVRAWDRWIVRRGPKRLAAWPGERLLQRGRYLTGELSALVRGHPRAIGGSLFAHVCFEAMALAMCFYAVGRPLPPVTLLLLYLLTVGVSTFGGLPGLAEVSLAALYTRFGLDPASAMAVALVYRLTDFWLPRAAGGLLWARMERQHSQHARVEVIT